MPYARINPSACEIRKDSIKLRLDLFLSPADPNYEKHHLYMPDWDSAEAQAGYQGEVDANGTPTDLNAYQQWGNSLPHIWVLTPFHVHMIHPLHTASDDEIRADITRCLGYFYAFKQHCWDSELPFQEEWEKVAFQEGQVRCPFVAGKSKDKNKNQNRLQDILSRTAEFEVGIAPVTEGIDLRIGKKGTITIGSAATDRASFYSIGTNSAVNTLINKNGAADGDGTIDTVEAFFNLANAGNNFRVGIFFDHESNNYYTCKDVENLGEVGAGYQEFTGLSLTTLTGESIGCDGTTGGSWLKIDRDVTGGVTCRVETGNANCVVDDYSQYGTVLETTIVSLYGTGNGAVPITLELRSSTDTDARLELDTEITLSLRSSTDTDARLTLDTGIGLSLRSSIDTAARLTLNTGIAPELRSSTDTDARLALDTLVGLALRSSSATRAAIEITVTAATSLELRSATDTDARLTFDTGIELALRSSTDTAARLTLQVVPELELRSSNDTRASLALSALISPELRSSTSTRAAIALTVALVTEIECRSETSTRAAIELDTLIALALRSLTATRAALSLVTVYRYQAITMAMQDRSLSMSMQEREFEMSIPSRTFDSWKVRQDG